jgi:hypothetical protein
MSEKTYPRELPFETFSTVSTSDGGGDNTSTPKPEIPSRLMFRLGEPTSDGSGSVTAASKHAMMLGM